MLIVVQADISMVKKVIPEINLIEDDTTRDKVARIWAYVWRQSSWTSLTDACFDPDVQGFSLVDHVRATVCGSEMMADIVGNLKGIQLDRQLLYILALLHDVSKVVEYECKDGINRKSTIGNQIQHGFYGAHLALLEGFSWDVIHLILTHTPQSKMRPKLVEGILFCHIDAADADISYFNSGNLERLLLRGDH